MATSTPAKAIDEKSLHEDEATKMPADPMLAIYLEYASQTPQWKAHHTSRLLRKVDLRLLPLLIVIYLLNFLDRSNLAQARLGTLEKDLGMKGTDFNLATSILFVVCVSHSFLFDPWWGAQMLMVRVRDTLQCNSHLTCYSPESNLPSTLVLRWRLEEQFLLPKQRRRHLEDC
jgi:hypothetical protein